MVQNYLRQADTYHETQFEALLSHSYIHRPTFLPLQLSGLNENISHHIYLKSIVVAQCQSLSKNISEIKQNNKKTPNDILQQKINIENCGQKVISYKNFENVVL